MTRWTLGLLLSLLLVPAVGAQAPRAPVKTETAIFAGGCFWCVEADFDKVDGVLTTTSGYIGGRTANPTYPEVSAGGTGYAEAVRVEFDPARVSYAQLLEKFWPMIDPTVKDQQFCDVGSQYRTAIFALDARQLKEAEASKAALQKSKPFSAPIVTEIVLAGTFYPAEEYHQDYHLKNPIRYAFYRRTCGRDARLKQLWGDRAMP
ncbi:MAG TPA: peptide-methionine (S)-S-oxide reductase MsrA [Burkholderiaceae bacterium]|nr:peptide-methionine (S)-S-oxide reductase MsrA [Burkholderiaceae bacterium]HQR72112.1 peptide-methionine (S)-S-oxide reductase MsrA [Burkholderiaceae bacterium]